MNLTRKEVVLQKILTAQATEGMVLARDLETAEGRVLCGKGTELTSTLLDRLKKMDISHVTVEGNPVQDPSQKSLQEELQDIDERFSRVEHIPPLMYIKKRIKERAVTSRRV
jgi:hypothetical protein